jgi:predicted lipid-binding transport protein (Tim44 family)
MGRGVITHNTLTLLALSGLVECLALLVGGKLAAIAKISTLVAAVLFGTALGLRALVTDWPLPAVLRFVAMASFATLAFYRSGSWIRQKVE